MKTASRKVPQKALRFDAVPFQLSAGEPGDDSTKAPIRMRARSGQPIEHWYWGKVVHDMAGFRAANEKLPVDYCHDSEEILGYLDEFKAGNEGLDVAGEVVSFQKDDRAAEVMFKARAGVPYQASIFFDPGSMILEQINEGFSTQVNGYTLQGPALVIRQWALRGVAVCPYGADGNTSTQFQAGHLPSEIDVSFLSEDPPMSKPTTPPAADATPPVPTEQKAPPADATPPSDARAQFAEELKRFTTRFGAVNGTKWFTEGKSFEQALELHCEEQSAQLTAKDAQIAGLKGQASAADALRGESTPAKFAAGDPPPAGQGNGVPAKFAHLGDNVAKIAAGIKLPK